MTEHNLGILGGDQTITSIVRGLKIFCEGKNLSEQSVDVGAVPGMEGWEVRLSVKKIES